MAGVIMMIVVIGAIAYGVMNRCKLLPQLCGGVGDQRDPFPTKGENLTDFQRNLATAAPTVPIVKSPDRIFKVPTKGEALTPDLKKIAGAYAHAHYSKSLGQFTNRLSI